MLRRHELSEAEGEFVRSLLPVSLRGRKRLDDRTVLNGIVWKFRTGTAWRDVPERYGPWHTLHTRFRRWALDGTFERMLQPPRPGRTRRKRSTGWCRSTPPSSTPTTDTRTADTRTADTRTADTRTTAPSTARCRADGRTERRPAAIPTGGGPGPCGSERPTADRGI